MAVSGNLCTPRLLNLPTCALTCAGTWADLRRPTPGDTPQLLLLLVLPLLGVSVIPEGFRVQEVSVTGHMAKHHIIRASKLCSKAGLTCGPNFGAPPPPRANAGAPCLRGGGAQISLPKARGFWAPPPRRQGACSGPRTGRGRWWCPTVGPGFLEMRRWGLIK